MAMSAFPESGRSGTPNWANSKVRFRPQADTLIWMNTQIIASGRDVPTTTSSTKLLFADPFTVHLVTEVWRPTLLPDINEVHGLGKNKKLWISSESQSSNKDAVI